MRDPGFVFRSLLGMVGCDLFLDIGSRDGGSSLNAAKLLSHADFVLFEASPENFAIMRDDPRLDRPGFVVENLAVSDREGDIRFFLYRNPAAPDNRGLSSTKRRHDLEPVGEVRVPAVTIDGYLESHPRQSGGEVVMWIDVEGAAFEVLRGSENTLRNTALVFVELEVDELFADGHGRSEVVAWMEARGFREIAWGPHDRDGSKGDSLFIRDEVHERLEVAARIPKWESVLRREARRRRIYEAVRRVPFLHAIWKLVRR